MFPISNIFIKTSMTMILFFREKTLVLQERFGSSVPDNKKHLSAHHHVKHKRHFGWKTELWATRWPIDRSLWKSSLLHDNFGKKKKWSQKNLFHSKLKETSRVTMLNLNFNSQGIIHLPLVGVDIIFMLESPCLNSSEGSQNWIVFLSLLSLTAYGWIVDYHQ